jgi:nitrite reductase/ring-hydroxylating ferredoxin subunit
VFARETGDVYAMDARCYHMGGPLWEGDIEDLMGGVVRCPWHSYRIVLATGVGVYENLQHEWVSKPGGVKQRTHDARVATDNGEIEVRLRLDAPERCESDHYCDAAVMQRAGLMATRGKLGGGGGGGAASASTSSAPPRE